LGHNVEFHRAAALLTSETIQAAIPLRADRLNSHSGYSTRGGGLPAIRISGGPIDRVLGTGVKSGTSRKEYLTIHIGGSGGTDRGGIDASDGWMSSPHPVGSAAGGAEDDCRRILTFRPNAKARKVYALLEAEVAQRTFPGRRSYTLESASYPAGHEHWRSAWTDFTACRRPTGARHGA